MALNPQEPPLPLHYCFVGEARPTQGQKYESFWKLQVEGSYRLTHLIPFLAGFSLLSCANELLTGSPGNLSRRTDLYERVSSWWPFLSI